MHLVALRGQARCELVAVDAAGAVRVQLVKQRPACPHNTRLKNSSSTGLLGYTLRFASRHGMGSSVRVKLREAALSTRAMA